MRGPVIEHPSGDRFVAGEWDTWDLVVCRPAEDLTRFPYPTIAGLGVAGGTTGNNKGWGGEGNGRLYDAGELTLGIGLGR